MDYQRTSHRENHQSNPFAQRSSDHLQSSNMVPSPIPTVPMTQPSMQSVQPPIPVNNKSNLVNGNVHNNQDNDINPDDIEAQITEVRNRARGM